MEHHVSEHPDGKWLMEKVREWKKLVKLPKSAQKLQRSEQLRQPELSKNRKIRITIAKAEKQVGLEELFSNAKDLGSDSEMFRGFDEKTEKSMSDLSIRERKVISDLLDELSNGNVDKLVGAITAMNMGGPVSLPPDLVEGPPEYAPKLKLTRVLTLNTTMDELLEKLQKPLAAGWKREVIYRSMGDLKADVVQYVSPDGTELRTEQEVIDYLENIYGISDDPSESAGLGKHNFSFYRSPLTALSCDSGEFIYVVDSSGRKRLVNVKRMKQTSPKKDSDEPLSIPSKEDEPSEQPVIPNKGIPLQKREGPFRQRGMGKPGRGVIMNSSNAQQLRQANTGIRMENAARGGFRRQRMQRNNMAQNMNRHDDAGIFTISSMHQADPILISGLEERRGQMRRERELYDAQNQFGNDMDDEEVLPCSIRCPGMTGQVPTLQCKSCLCLYHGACLGIPPGAKFVNFICPNCDAKQNPEHPSSNKASMGQGVPVHMQRQRQMVKPQQNNQGNQGGINPMMTRRIGQTVISPEFHPIGKGGMSVKRMDVRPPELPGTRSRMAGLPLQNMGGIPKRGLWPSPKIPFPPLGSGGKGVTIIPMAKIPRGRAPPLPTLHPMLPNSSHSLTPPPIRGRANFNLRGMPKLNAFGASGIRSIVPLPDLSRKRGASPQAMPMNNKRISLCSPQEKKDMTKQWAASAGQFRQYPQSIVIIGNKKYIVMPHGQTDKNKNQLDSASETETDSKVTMGNGHDLGEKLTSEDEAFVLKKIFPYLSIRDLLAASRVCRSWNQAASDKDLWTSVRMKNAHIFDFHAFVNLLNQRKTEVLDLRKMAYESETDWDVMADSLSKISSLKKVILGQRSAPSSLVEMVAGRCPNVEILA